MRFEILVVLLCSFLTACVPCSNDCMGCGIAGPADSYLVVLAVEGDADSPVAVQVVANQADPADGCNQLMAEFTVVLAESGEIDVLEGEQLIAPTTVDEVDTITIEVQVDPTTVSFTLDGTPVTCERTNLEISCS